MERLNIKNNYFYQGDKPFFWLADTAWLLFDKLNENEAKRYLRNRSELGYNVIQAVLVYYIPGLNTIDGMPHNNIDVMNIAYWNKVKKIVDYANELNLYMALLPCWGTFIKNNLLTKEDINKYTMFLTDFFKDNHIIWVLGGDIKGDTNLELYNYWGKKLKEKDSNSLITFHPFGRTGSYLWFNDANWLDFNMFQSGHRRYDQIKIGTWDDNSLNEDTFGESSYKYVIKNNSYKIIKPCLDAEPSYEGIVQGLHDPLEPYWEARHIRRYLYFSVLEGACGFTYGNNAIIQFYKDGEKPAYGVRENWEQGLHSPGSSQMQYLKDLFYSLNFTSGKARPELVTNQRERLHRISVFAGSDFIICYTYYGDKIVLNLKEYGNTLFDAYWINPENNAKSYINTFNALNIPELRPIRRHELSNDWILLLLNK